MAHDHSVSSSTGGAFSFARGEQILFRINLHAPQAIVDLAASNSKELPPVFGIWRNSNLSSLFPNCVESVIDSLYTPRGDVIKDKLLLQQYIQDDTPKINIIATNNTPVEILDR